MKITILGTGAYGLALALMFRENPSTITMWTKFEEEKEMLEKERCHKKVLPGIKIPEDIKFTTDLEEAMQDSNLVVFATPAQFVDAVASDVSPYFTENMHILVASKGIENGTSAFVHDVILRYIKTDKLAVISGPTFAVDIASYVPVGLTLASKNEETDSFIKKTLQNQYLKIRSNNDILGTEICGSIKNVIAIASGMIDGMNLPISTKAMFITESLHDIKELIDALGGDKNTILSYAGFGDLLLTCTSEKSRNFMLGKKIGMGCSQEEIDDYIKNTTIEGLYTLASIYQLLQNKKVSMPIIDLIDSIIKGKRDPKALLSFLIEK